MSADLQFSIGPVQGFIAQARRTRDLWGGSYLLSYLSGVAMDAALAAGGEIVHPTVGDPLHGLIHAIRDAGSVNPDGAELRFGSLVNRFHTSFDSADKAAAAARESREAVEKCWKRLCDATWELVRPAIPNGADSAAKATWERQTAGRGPWEIQWAVGEPEALDRRKNIRDFRLEAEPGEKCTVCGERSALAGGGAARREVQLFWEQFGAGLRKRTHGAIATDGGERLCAVCATKRLFPLDEVSRRALGRKVGWNYPSTSTVATALWRKRVLEAALTCDKVRTALQDLCAALKESGNQVVPANLRGSPTDDHQLRKPVLTAAVRTLEAAHPGQPWDELIFNEGSFFLSESLGAGVRAQWEEGLGKRFRSRPGRKEAEFSDEERAALAARTAELAGALEGLQEAVGSKAPAFFTILAMDGDGIGRALGEAEDNDRRRAISGALREFAAKAPEIVESDEHCGWTVYCGADDLLALLPVDTALPCADAVRRLFADCVRSLAGAGERPFTISAALVYAHVATHLQGAIEDAHRLLDEVAKKELGRNAFAVRVWKRGGPILTWGKPWDTGKSEETSWPALVGKIAASIAAPAAEAGDDEAGKGVYSNRLIYRVQERLRQLKGAGRLDEATQVALIQAEHASTRSGRNRTQTQQDRARGEAQQLRELLLEEWHDREGSPQRGKALRSEGALLARFLAQKELG